MNRQDTPALVLSAALAFAYGLFSRDWAAAGTPLWALAGLKASCIGVLAMLALSHNARWLALGLLCGAAGDALLALETNASFLAGAGAFLIGHVCYSTLFLRAGVGLRVALTHPARASAMIVLAGMAVAMSVLLVPAASPLFAPLAVYSGVLTVMTMASFTLPATRWLAMTGAVLFFISDGFVALNMFHPHPAPATEVALSITGWLIYWAGQAGLCLGALTLPMTPRAV